MSGAGNYKASGIAYDEMYAVRQINLVKVYNREVANVDGIICNMHFDVADDNKAHKRQGILDGVKHVFDYGFEDFGGSIDFYTSMVQGFQAVACHRKFGGTRKAVVLLGAGAVNTQGMIGRTGIADKVGSHSKSAYCAAVVVHELGHNIHERTAEDYFWTAAANQPPANVQLAMEVSQYAATSPKEVVAEVFTALAYKLPVRPAILDMYSSYHGPYPRPRPGMRRRRD